MKKSIKVYTNDPKNEKISLELSGQVKKFVTLNPRKVFLKGNIGESISQVVSITPGEGESFKILQVNALKGHDYKHSLKEVEKDGKKIYELTVENTRATAGRYFDKIFMITDRADQQPISLIVSGYIDDPQKQNAETGEGTEDTGNADMDDPDAAGENEPEEAAQ